MKDVFSDKRYPGRFIVIGEDHGSAAVIYGATGRSPSSLKRIFVEQGDGVYMTAVDATVKIEGNPELLEYPAVRIFDNGIIAANGRQIDRVESLDPADAPDAFLLQSLAGEIYEPDEHKTPRITGCVIETEQGWKAALHIARSQGSTAWPLALNEGVGSYISTYTGADVRPTPSFEGAPLPVSLDFGSAHVAVQAMYEAFKPKEGEQDYRIAFLAVYKKKGEEPEIAIVNRLQGA